MKEYCILYGGNGRVNQAYFMADNYKQAERYFWDYYGNGDIQILKVFEQIASYME